MLVASLGTYAIYQCGIHVVCGVVPVAAIVPVLLPGAYWHYRWTISVTSPVADQLRLR